MKPTLSKNRASLDGIEAFLLVAERRSFTAAAAELGVSPSAISQTIRALEERTGAPLLMRTTRSVGLTEAGERFRDHARPAFDGIYEAFDAARNLAARPAGRLRINLMRAVIHAMFQPILAGFCATYPDIELEIFAEDGLIDLMHDGFDAGIRIGEQLAADMVAVRLTDPFRFVVAATPAYFERYGRPTEPADLVHHNCLRFRLKNGAMMHWTFNDGGHPFDVPVTGSIIVNDSTAQMVAIRSGAVIGKVAEPTIRTEVDAGTLEIVLANYATGTDGLFLYYPDRRQVMPKLRAFIDYIKAHLPERFPYSGDAPLLK